MVVGGGRVSTGVLVWIGGVAVVLKEGVGSTPTVMEGGVEVIKLVTPSVNFRRRPVRTVLGRRDSWAESVEFRCVEVVVVVILEEGLTGDVVVDNCTLLSGEVVTWVVLFTAIEVVLVMVETSFLGEGDEDGFGALFCMKWSLGEGA